MIIDMHCHVVPEHFPPAGNRASAARWPSMDHFEAGRANVMIEGRNFRTVHSGNWEVQRRLKDMDSHSATAQAISPMPELMSYWFTPEDGLDFSRYVNEYIAGMCEQAPDRLFGLGMVPLQDPDLAAKELSNIKDMGLAGIELGTHVNGRSIGMPEFQDFYKEAERLGVAIFVHALHPTMMERLPERSQANPIGFPTEVALAIGSIIGSGIAEACPDLRIAFSHGGGAFPFMLARYHNQWSGTWNEESPVEGRGVSMPNSPSEYARRFYYDTLLFDHRAIRFLIDMVGYERVVVGTDYPYQPPEQPCDRSLSMLDLPREQHEAITWHNCFRFLGVEAPALTS
jgi:aminocarboxymuconate-semialdehyde decarboxylase